MAHGPWKPGFGRFYGSRSVSVEWAPFPTLAENRGEEDRESCERPGEPREAGLCGSASPRRTERFVTDWFIEE